MSHILRQNRPRSTTTGATSQALVFGFENPATTGFGFGQETEPTDEPPLKHQSYFMSLLADRKISDYFLVAADTSNIFKVSTEQIIECLGRWNHDLEDYDDTGLLKASSRKELRETCVVEGPNNKGLIPLKGFGGKIMKLSELLGTVLNKRDTEEREGKRLERIMNRLQPLAKDAAKLKRKLGRINDTILPDLKDLRSLAETHGILGNNEEERGEEDFGNYHTESVTDATLRSLVPQNFVDEEEQYLASSVKIKNRSCFIVRFFKFVFPCSKGDKEKKKSHKSSKPETPLPDDDDIQLPVEKPSQKHIEKIVSSLVIKTARKSTSAIKVKLAREHEDEEYVTEGLSKLKPGTMGEAEWGKRLGLDVMTEYSFDPPGLGSNSVNSVSFKPEGVISPMIIQELDDQEVKDLIDKEAEKLLPKIMENIRIRTGSDLNQNENEGNEEDLEEPEDEDEDDDVDLQKVPGLYSLPTLGGDDILNVNTELDVSEKNVALSPTEESSELGTILEEQEDLKASVDLDLQHLNESLLLQEIFDLVEDMHQTVSLTTNQIRELERSWLDTTTRAVEFRKNCSAVLRVGDMLDYIKDMIALLNDTQFSGEVKAQTRQRVVAHLDPVYREFHSCFMALGELGRTVGTDAIYLGKLVDHMPEVPKFDNNVDNLMDTASASYGSIEEEALVEAEAGPRIIDAFFQALNNTN